MNPPHDLEDAVRDRFERAMSDTTAPVDTLRAAAMTNGRRLRRRRQSLLVVSAVVAIAITGLGIQQASGGSEAKEANEFANPDPSDETSPATPDVVPEGWWSMPATTMADELRELLPDGMRLTNPITTNDDRAPGESLEEMTGYVIATLRLESGGPGKVNMVFYPPDDNQPPPPPSTDSEGNVDVFLDEQTQEQRLSCDPDAVTRPENCEQLKAADGTVIGRVLDSTVSGVRSLGIDLATDDGGVVMVNVANTLDDKWPDGASPSADEIPLTLAQLRRIAENPVWTSYRP